METHNGIFCNPPEAHSLRGSHASNTAQKATRSRVDSNRHVESSGVVRVRCEAPKTLRTTLRFGKLPTRDERLLKIWKQKAVPVVLRRGAIGERLRVRIPYSSEVGAWLQNTRRNSPQWNDKDRCLGTTKGLVQRLCRSSPNPLWQDLYHSALPEAGKMRSRVSEGYRA